MDEVVVQQRMLDAVDGLAGLASHIGQANPDQHGTSNMIALDSSLAALAAFDTRELFDLAMKLLDLPADATHFLRRIRRILSQIVGHDPVRAVGRHRDPEQLHLVILGKALDLDALALAVQFPG